MVSDLTGFHLDAAIKRHSDVQTNIFGLDDFQDLLRWTGEVEGPLRARMLSALVDQAAPAEILSAAAQAIIACDNWQVLVTELVLTGETTAQLARVVSQVLAVHAPGHAVARFDKEPSFAFTVFDGVSEQDNIIFLDERSLPHDQPWIILDPHNLVTNWTLATASQVEGGYSIAVGQLPWLENHRVACSAFLVIIT